MCVERKIWSQGTQGTQGTHLKTMRAPDDDKTKQAAAAAAQGKHARTIGLPRAHHPSRLDHETCLSEEEEQEEEEKDGMRVARDGK